MYAAVSCRRWPPTYHRSPRASANSRHPCRARVRRTRVRTSPWGLWSKRMSTVWGVVVGVAAQTLACKKRSMLVGSASLLDGAPNNSRSPRSIGPKCRSNRSSQRARADANQATLNVATNRMYRSKLRLGGQVMGISLGRLGKSKWATGPAAGAGRGPNRSNKRPAGRPTAALHKSLSTQGASPLATHPLQFCKPDRKLHFRKILAGQGPAVRGRYNGVLTGLAAVPGRPRASGSGRRESWNYWSSKTIP